MTPHAEHALHFRLSVAFLRQTWSPIRVSAATVQLRSQGERDNEVCSNGSVWTASGSPHGATNSGWEPPSAPQHCRTHCSKKKKGKAERCDRSMELVTADRSAGTPAPGGAAHDTTPATQSLQPSPSQLCGLRSAHAGTVAHGAFVSREARKTFPMRLNMCGGGLSSKHLYQLSQDMQ